MPLPQSMFEPRTWNMVAPGYAAEIATTFSTFADDALELGCLRPGERVLDVATGPGTLAIPAARLGARVFAVDFAPRMIAELESRVRREDIRGIEARVADATALPFGDDEFDAVFSMFALNLIANRDAAFREILRVLRMGGRAVVGTPADVTRTPAFADVRDIVRRAMPQLDLEMDLPLAEPSTLLAEMAAAGFANVEVQRVTRSFAYPSAGALWAIASRAGAPLVVVRDAMPEEEWSRATEAIVRDLERRFGSGPQRVELTVNLAHARKERVH
jgi:ubiquinone/menaquinone biosynthesis C-methylase UbiE